MSKTILEDFLTNSAKLGLLLADDFMLHALAKSWFLEVINLLSKSMKHHSLYLHGSTIPFCLAEPKVKEEKKEVAEKIYDLPKNQILILMLKKKH